MNDKKPKYWVSLIVGVALIALFMGLYYFSLLYGGSITIYLILALLTVSIGLFVGEIIHIHRKLNYLLESINL